jgi:reactive intermediate/imine deaminase
MTVYQVIDTGEAPAALGTYSQAVIAGSFVFLSGQIGLKPGASDLVEGVRPQLEQIFKNMRAVLATQGLDLSHLVRVVIFLQDMADFPLVNQVMTEYFTAPYPARTTVCVTKLPKNASVEVEGTAVM